MPKFSIVVPIYNVEEYLDKCLKSIKNQTFTDYEVILVNDGTKDNSMEIAKKYNYKILNQSNKGLSEARNNGAKKAVGDYIIFLDSDDYLEKDLLKEVNDSLENNPDIVRFQIKEVFADHEVNYEEESFTGLNGVEAFNIISKYHFVENAWCYAIERSYYKQENYKFQKGTIHEDFGLIPLVIIKASIVNSINYLGYNYLQRQGSIMSVKNYDKTKKKVEDFYNHYNYLIKEINRSNIDSKVFKSFISNSLILKITELNKEDYKKYKERLKEDKVFDNLLSDTISRKLKKLLIKRSPRLYYKIVVK